MWALDPDGNFVAAERLGGGSTDTGIGVAVTREGGRDAVWLTGAFQGTTTGLAALTSAGGYDVYVLKTYQSGGAFTPGFAAGYGGVGDDGTAGNREVGSGLAVGSDGSVVVGGLFRFAVDFDTAASRAFTLTSAGASDGFLLKLDSAGGFVWARQIGGYGVDSIQDVALDASDNIYVTGQFQDLVDFDPLGGSYTLEHTGAGTFTARYTPAGSFGWATALPAPGLGGFSFSFGIAAGTGSRVVTVGRPDRHRRRRRVPVRPRPLVRHVRRPAANRPQPERQPERGPVRRRAGVRRQPPARRRGRRRHNDRQLRQRVPDRRRADERHVRRERADVQESHPGRGGSVRLRRRVRRRRCRRRRGRRRHVGHRLRPPVPRQPDGVSDADRHVGRRERHPHGVRLVLRHGHVAVITWGNGDITRIPLPSGTHTFTASYRYLDDDPTGTAGDAYTVRVRVEDLTPDVLLVDDARILRFDGTTGAPGGALTPALTFTGAEFTRLAVGPDGIVYALDGTVVRRFDAQTGASLGTLAAPGWAALAFGPDGGLYTFNPANTGVVRIDTATGAAVAFVPAGSGGLALGQSLAFGPDGNLYIGQIGTTRVLRYSGSTGAFLGLFAELGVGGVYDLAFGADGNLYAFVTSSAGVYRIDGGTGANLGLFIEDLGGVPGRGCGN